MAIAEKLDGINIAQRILFKVNERPHLTKINSKNVFTSPNGFVLTSFGIKVQRILINNNALEFLQEHPARLKEVASEIKETCDEIGIDENRLHDIGAQFTLLVEKRDLKIDWRYSGKGTIFQRLKKRIKSWNY